MPTLHWIGKEKVQTHHNDVPYRVLEKQYTYSKYGNAGDAGASPAGVGVDTDGPSLGGVGEVNKIIHGDNLETLKALLPEYENRVDCIYIDPPYNTGNEGWVYNDNVNDPHIRKWLGAVVGKEAEDLTRHDKWLCMMYPRLVLLQKLLSPTGAIFISIDDNEQANLKLICDEIFGAGNFVGTFKWNRVAKAPSLSYSIRTKYEYVFLYKKVDLPKLYGKNSYNTMAPLWHLPNKPVCLKFPAHSVKIPNSFEIGTYSEKYKVELLDRVIEKNGLNENTFKIMACSAWGQEKIDRYIAEGSTFVVKKSLSTMYTCMNPEGSFIAPSDLISDDECGVKRNTEANEDMKTMGINFEYSKPVSLIAYLIEIITHSNPNALILDSFAGSGTTAHAVLNLNKQDGGHRRFILVEMCDYAETITAERVRRVINGYGEGSKAVEGTGGSFAFYELGDTIYDPQTGLLNDHADTEQIRRYIWYSETNTPYHSPKDTGVAGDADALVRGRFGTNRMTMPYMGDDASRVVSTHPYLLGRKDGTNYYFYYKQGEETVLDRAFLNTFTPADQAEQYIIYADCCRLSRDFMLIHHITFKQIPRDIKKV
mgnify:FL=1